MYQIEKTDYGIKLKLAGFIELDEMKAWEQKMQDILRTTFGNFSMFIDMRELKPLLPECQAVIEKTQKKSSARIIRSVTITNKALTSMQFKKLSRKSGVIDSKLFINASKTPNWEEVGLNWILHGIYPDEINKKSA